MRNTEMNEIEAAKQAALARPDYLPQGNAGTEHIKKDDMQMPRLGLAQALSPQLIEGKPEYIPDLRAGQMFNTLSQQVYGKGPLTFSILRADPPRGIEFNPRDAGGGVKDPNVPLDDPRMKFTTGPNGESINPIATKFYDFILEINGSELIALSLKASGLKVARTLNGLIKLRNAPIWAGLYKVSSISVQGPKGTYYTYAISNAGWVSREDAPRVENLFNGLRDVVVNINREFSDADEDAPFGSDM